MTTPLADVSFEATRACADALDRADPLGAYRDAFSCPRRDDGGREVYFCGDSLGLMPTRAEAYVVDELHTWRDAAVRGHFQPPRPWLSYHELVTEGLARLVGARPAEVVAMNSLTVNLHLMLTSFYRPAGRRVRILMEDRAFPSDAYAVASHVHARGLDPERTIVRVAPRAGEERLRSEDIEAAIAQEGESLALVLWPGVQYYTGQTFALDAIVRAGHRAGAMVGFDLAHAAGNLELALHDWNADFACWCSYKYLNAGPGAVAGCFVHERHLADRERPRLAGWWGHDTATRFRMGPVFDPTPTADGWQLSNPPILSLAPLRASLELFDAATMPRLRRKSVALTGFLAFLLERRLGDAIEIVTPADAPSRGCQLSIRVRSGLPGRELLTRLERAGVACDFREPNVVRVAPTPFYNTFDEVYRFVEILSALV
ncbi:MAG: kynureninase [Vicinamibacterales bacterium]